MRRRDGRRSPEAAQWRRMYKGARWEKLRQTVKVRDKGLCQPCLRKTPKQITAGTVVHHKEAHKGDPVLFYDADNTELSCAPCHDGPLQSEEKLGYSRQIDVSGWPVDPKHPTNACR